MGAGHSHGPAADLDLSRAARLGSIGLVLSVPLTTGVAALTVGSAVAAASASATPRRAKPAHDHDHG